LNSINKIVKIYSSYLRPIKPLSKINLNNLKINKDCDVIIFSFHTYNLEKNLSNINFKDLELKTEYAPRVLYKESSKAGAIVFKE